MVKFSEQIEKLKGTENFHKWKFTVEHALKLQGFWKAVQGTEQSQEIQEKAMSRLILYISPNLYPHIQGISTAKDIWTKLCSIYDDSGLTRRWGLLRKLTTTQLENCANMSEYVDIIIDTAQKLNQIGMVVTEEWVGSLLLSGLPEHFRPMIMAMESSNLKITGDAIKTKLLQDYEYFNKDEGASGGSAAPLYSNKGKKHDHRERRFDTKRVVCYKCNKEGYVAKFCKNKSKVNNSNNVGMGSSWFLSSFIAHFNDDGTNWFIDSGASSHMAKNRDIFSIFQEFKTEEFVIVANNNKLIVIGRGNVPLQVFLNEKYYEVTLRNVYWCQKYV